MMLQLQRLKTHRNRYINRTCVHDVLLHLTAQHHPALGRYMIHQTCHKHDERCLLHSFLNLLFLYFLFAPVICDHLYDFLLFGHSACLMCNDKIHQGLWPQGV